MARTFEVRIAGNIAAINPARIGRVEGIGTNKKGGCIIHFDNKTTVVPEESFEAVVGQWNDALRA